MVSHLYSTCRYVLQLWSTDTNLTLMFWLYTITWSSEKLIYIYMHKIKYLLSNSIKIQYSVYLGQKKPTQTLMLSFNMSFPKDVGILFRYLSFILLLLFIERDVFSYIHGTFSCLCVVFLWKKWRTSWLNKEEWGRGKTRQKREKKIWVCISMYVCVYLYDMNELPKWFHD